ncbi:hypothetical protein LTR91_017353 [Friedmanniomyces endolithicus]|uniref:Probable beta-glucosidase G n=1 Tax=Friedmanniomyces endolithicus TaxID=329885 RepID=A0AAN6K699_9PEZI|nr:hypothetical protein LTR91_017353 [Friedmanniomyces endolithicus]
MGPMANKLHLAAGLLVAATAVTGQNGSTVGSGPSAAGPTWNHADFESSPAVYPSPNATCQGWSSAFQQASAFVSQLTLEEKAQLVTGTPGPCVGNIGPIERLGFKGLCLQDGPLAIREATYASVFPAGLSVAASWDMDLARQRGVEMAQEFKGKGAHIALGPVAGPLGRSGYGGRNWEGFSPDPYLTGELFATTIEGMQATGLQACAKHYIGNEQETQRNPSGGPNTAVFGGVPGPTIEAVSSNIDDRTMHEAYLWPFQNAVHSGVSAVMCSYNRINGSYGCQNSKTLNGLLKEELGFQGYVMSDWAATHSGYPAAEAGLDMDMPGGISFFSASPSFFGCNITASVNNGSLPIERVDDMCRRIMTPYFRLGQNTNYPPIDASSGGLNFFPVTNYLYNFTEGPANVDVRDDHAALIRELGAAGIVMLKNVNNTLPLKTPANVGVFGNDAPDISVGLYLDGDPDLLNIGYDQGVLPVGGGSGTGRMTYVVAPLDAIKTKVFSYNSKALVQYVTNNTEIIHNKIFGAMINPTPPEVCLPNVTAILAAHYPGQEVGNSIVDILWGAVNPSGKLPYTIALQESDYSFAPITNSSALLKTTDPNAWQSDFEERLLIDYRHFDYFNESVQYEFGYGLSYTTFSMSTATISRVASGAISAAPANNTVAPGGNPALWDILYTVSVIVSNTGSVAGATVPQLYLGLPQPANEDYTPVKVLRGFQKVLLAPGASQTVTFSLTRRDISYWDTFAQQWIIGSSAIGVLAGFSSRDIQSTTSFSPLNGASAYGGSSGSASSASSSVAGGYGAPSSSSSTVGGYSAPVSSPPSSTAGGYGAPSPSSSTVGGYGAPSPSPSPGYGAGGHGGDQGGPWHWASGENGASHWGLPPAAAKQ